MYESSAVIIENISNIEVTFSNKDKNKLLNLLLLLNLTPIYVEDNKESVDNLINSWSYLHLYGWKNHELFQKLNKISKTPISIEKWREIVNS